MREIKFRVWDLITQSYGGGNLWNILADGTLSYGNAEWKHGIVQLYTGLKDKNGTEIYESDKLKAGEFEYLVKWSNENGAWICEPIQIDNYITTSKPLFAIIEDFEGVVTGNEYE